MLNESMMTDSDDYSEEIFKPTRCGKFCSWIRHRVFCCLYSYNTGDVYEPGHSISESDLR
jgi:hypothetical protein